MVTVVAAEMAGAYGVAAAFAAVTMQVPALVALSALPVIRHPVAVPFTTEYVTAPVPEPPLVARVRGESR